jgi:hypothetical protein
MMKYEKKVQGLIEYQIIIGAIVAFVANANDSLHTVVADSVMNSVAASRYSSKFALVSEKPCYFQLVVLDVTVAFIAPERKI